MFVQTVCFFVLFFFLPWGLESNGKKRGTCFEGKQLCFWSSHCSTMKDGSAWRSTVWKGELKGGWTEGGVCLGGISISNCVALLSVSKHFLFKRVRKYRPGRIHRREENRKQHAVRVLTFSHIQDSDCEVPRDICHVNQSTVEKQIDLKVNQIYLVS